MPSLRALVAVLVAAAFLIVMPQPASAQETPEVTADKYVPATPAERVDWIVDGVVGRQSLLIVGPLADLWQTGFNTPEEWGRGPSGIAKRYAERLADVGISNSIEGGLGALWGEDPRYIKSGRKGIWPRARYALKTSVLAQGRDGRFRPTWARYAGNTLNNVIENAWLPPSQTTPTMTAVRSGMGIVTRIGGNLWEEFWPDVAKRLKKR